MHEFPVLIFAALLIFGFGLFSKIAERSPVSAPMVFVSVGMLAGPAGLGFVSQGINAPLVRVLSEITLVLVLFVDASTIDVRSLAHAKSVPLRLLLIGLPLTMAAGFAAAVPLFGHVSFWALALMAFILAPTDAALGQPVVTSPAIPDRIKEAINVESGLNDGIALPPILACIAVLSAAAEKTGASYWALFTLKQFVFGPFLGALVGWSGGKLVDIASQKGWMNTTFQRLAAWSLAVLAFALAESFHGNGFIAAFFGGLMLGTHTPIVRERIQEFGEAEGQQLALFVFLVFGLVAVPATVGYWDAAAWAYAVLSLTVVRMLPVAVCLAGSRLGWRAVGMIGWFGPRGIASVLYLLLVVNELGLPGNERILSVIVLTVLLSVYLHGLSAVPLAGWYARNAPEEADRSSVRV
jgi:NhaP-type Na+/H+ or K+/H+ antiporter